MKAVKSLEDQLYLMGWIFLGIGSILTWLYLKFLLPHMIIGCVWDRFLGIYCPGCGGTRSAYALLEGHLLQSLWYHPLVPYSIIIFGSFMISQTAARLTGFKRIKGMPYRNWYLIVAVIILVLNFIVKNVLRFFYGIIL